MCFRNEGEIMFLWRITRGLFLLSATFLISLTACNLNTGTVATPTMESTSIPSPIVPTLAQPQMPLVYYYFAAIKSNTFPAGSVVILPNQIILSPTVSTTMPAGDVATDVKSALQIMMSDARNLWKGDRLTVSHVTFSDGQANVELSGSVTGTGDIVLVAARLQFLMTVFANADVQNAKIMLNGANIANLGTSHSSEAKPADYVYSRAEIESFMQKNAYNP